MTDHDRIPRIESKLDEVKEDLSEIKSTLSAQHVSLKEHMRRTELLEEAIIPIQKKVFMLDGVFKLLGISGVIVGIGAAIVEILSYIKGVK